MGGRRPSRLRALPVAGRACWRSAAAPACCWPEWRPGLRRVHGIDFSQASGAPRPAPSARPGRSWRTWSCARGPPTTLRCGRGDEVDFVILNSVVQYFPRAGLPGAGGRAGDRETRARRPGLPRRPAAPGVARGIRDVGGACAGPRPRVGGRAAPPSGPRDCAEKTNCSYRPRRSRRGRRGSAHPERARQSEARPGRQRADEVPLRGGAPPGRDRRTGRGHLGRGAPCTAHRPRCSPRGSRPTTAGWRACGTSRTAAWRRRRRPRATRGRQRRARARRPRRPGPRPLAQRTSCRWQRAQGGTRRCPGRQPTPTAASTCSSAAATRRGYLSHGRPRRRRTGWPTTRWRLWWRRTWCRS